MTARCHPPTLPRRAVLAGGAALIGGVAHAVEAVDLLLVLAVDVSRSIDAEEAQLQRQGYQQALTDREVVAAIAGGALGAIALAYVEWAGFTYQRLVIPWTRIGSQADASGWAATLAQSPRESMAWTSISGALIYSHRVLGDCPFEAARRVIDVSGDGVNNNGPPPETERDQLVAEGVTINGLPIINDRPNFGMDPRPGLEEYYRDSVIGGPRAFLIVADDFAAFGAAIKRKLIQEIAAIHPSVRAG